MAATALINVSAKVTGVESADSLAALVYEIAKRFNAVAPADVQAGHKTSTDAYVAVPPTGGTVAGVLLFAEVEALKVSLGTTADELDFTIPEGQAAFVPGPAGTMKVQRGAAQDGEYDYIVFGAAA